MILYTYQIDLDTLEIKSASYEEKELEPFYTGYAKYEKDLDGQRVYAESLKSENDAQHLAYDFCKKFSDCMDKIRYEARSNHTYHGNR